MDPRPKDPYPIHDTGWRITLRHPDGTDQHLTCSETYFWRAGWWKPEVRVAYDGSMGGWFVG
jgi:hypothetical protein